MSTKLMPHDVIDVNDRPALPDCNAGGLITAGAVAEETKCVLGPAVGVATAERAVAVSVEHLTHRCFLN